MKKIKRKESISSAIFKAYDIRGKYPEEVNENAAYFIGRAFVKFIRCSQEDNPEIVIGRDNRLSSDSLFASLAQGINDEGGKVTDIGLATTPMLYFASAHYDFDGGIMISASHNPSSYNGFKLVKKGAIPISGETGLVEIKGIADAFEREIEESNENFEISKKDVLLDYLNFNFKEFKIDNFDPFKVVVDTANAVPGILIPEASQRSCLKISHLFSDLDGTFPNHSPDPLVEENLSFLRDKVVSQKADLGVAFDGDGDRVVFLDEKGKVVPADLISALISKNILADKPGEKFLCDVRFSNAVREIILEKGGYPIIGRVGHSFIKEKMRKENIIFAGEFSGHFYHRDHYFSEAPWFVFLKIIEIMSQEKKSLSEIIKPLKRYWHSGEINFRIEDKNKKLAQLKDHYTNGRILEIDGLRVDFEKWWFLVRASNTEPLLRLIVEAEDEPLLKEKIEELSQFISS